MPALFTCRHCGNLQPRNPRIKKQKYCSSTACQNARKRHHDKKASQKTCGKDMRKGRNKRWRDKAPAHAYQAQYRKDHPEYVEKNRQQQRRRNNTREKMKEANIVKTDALLLQPRYDGAYTAFKVKRQKIVKTDALLLKMQAGQGIEAHFMKNST